MSDGISIDELAKAAVAAGDEYEMGAQSSAWREFREAVSPQTILSLSSRVEALEGALGLALIYLFQYEPCDSRAVSNEFVAMASVEAGSENEECLQIIKDATDKMNAIALSTQA